MREDSKQFIKFMGKWLMWGLIILGLWILEIFKVVAILSLLLAQEFNKFLVWMGEPTEGGAGAYWGAYWVYWTLAYIALFTLFIFWWFVFYRNKRPNLMLDGKIEGRVLWTKGFRDGLTYGFWDAYNYLKGEDSPFVRGSGTDVSSTNTGTVPGTLRDPLEIPIGRATLKRIVYFSKPWSLKIEKLILPDYWQLKRTYWTVRIPRGYMMNHPDPLIPGAMILSLTLAKPGYNKFDPSIPVKRQIAKLEETRTLVQYGVAANPEIAQIDYSDGSLPDLDG